MNITQYLKTVNAETLEKPQITETQRIILSELAYCSFAESGMFEEAVSDSGVRYHKIKLADGAAQQYHCSFNIPVTVAENPKPKKEEKKHRKSKELLYPEVFECSRNGESIEPLIKPLLKKVSDKWGYLASWFGDKYRFFLVNAKGTPAYNLKQYWRIHDACKTLDEHYNKCFFATLTLAQKDFEGNFIYAWKYMSEKLGNFLKDLTRTFGGKYVVVLESHKSGFPHAHLLFYTNYDFSDCSYKYSKKKHCYFMNNGSLRDFFTEKWKCGFSQIDKNRRKDTSNYLSKYISKAEDKDIRELLGKSRLSESDKKEVLTMILPMIAEVRAFRVSKLEFPTVQTAQSENVTEFSISEKAKRDDPPAPLAPLTEKERDFAIAYLKTQCNKSPLNCANPIFSHQRGELLKLYKVEPSRLADLPLARNKKIAESGCRLSCKGCILSKLADLFVNGDTSIVDNAKNWKVLALMSKWNYKRIDDKSVGFTSEKQKEIRKEYKEIQSERDMFFLFPNKEKMANRFYQSVKESLLKTLPEEEIDDFIIAAYKVNPMIAPFVLPKKWVKIIQWYSLYADNELKNFSPEEIQLFKECIPEFIFWLTKSASGTIITE